MKNKLLIKLHSYHIVIILIVGILLGSIGVGFFIQTNPLIRFADEYLYQVIHRSLHFKFLDFLILPFNYNFLPSELSPLKMPSYYYFMILGTLIYTFIYKRSLVLWIIFCFIFGSVLALLITAIDWHFIFRERPFLKLDSDVDQIGRSAWEKLSSFPSGHARETALYSTIMATFIPKIKWVMLIFVIFIAYSRVYIGAHYPTDVIAGVLIGFLTAKATLMISRELQIIYGKMKGGKHGETPKGASTDIHKS